MPCSRRRRAAEQTRSGRWATCWVAGPTPSTRSRARARSAPSRCWATTTTARPAPSNRRASARPGRSPCARSSSRASGWATTTIAWLRTRQPAARRGDVQCWHGSPRNAVHEFVGASNAAACLGVQKATLGLVAHTHVPAAWREEPRGVRQVRIAPGEPLEISSGQVAPRTPARSVRRSRPAPALVRRPRGTGRGGRVLAAPRPRAADRDLASRPVRSGAGAASR